MFADECTISNIKFVNDKGYQSQEFPKRRLSWGWQSILLINSFRHE